MAVLKRSVLCVRLHSTELVEAREMRGLRWHSQVSANVRHPGASAGRCSRKFLNLIGVRSRKHLARNNINQNCDLKNPIKVLATKKIDALQIETVL